MHLSQVIQLLILGVVNTNENFQILSCNDVNKETVYIFSIFALKTVPFSCSKYI